MGVQNNDLTELEAEGAIFDSSPVPLSCEGGQDCCQSAAAELAADAMAHYSAPPEISRDEMREEMKAL